MCQQEGDSVDQYITELYILTDNEFEEKRDDMIRDRLVVGIKDKLLLECLQLVPNLTLETAKKWYVRKKWSRSNKHSSKEMMEDDRWNREAGQKK